MTSESQPPKPPLWELPSWLKGSIPNPLDMFSAPQSLTQPILPGWVFGTEINVQNSSAPDTERLITSAHSYGRQLGRIMDAVAALIAELPPETRQAPAFAALLALQREIDELKRTAAAKRLDRLAADLEMLKQQKPEDYDRVAAKLREVLKL